MLQEVEMKGEQQGEKHGEQRGEEHSKFQKTKEDAKNFYKLGIDIET